MRRKPNLSQALAYNKVYVIAEIGINHNGSIKTAKKLINEAAETGTDAVKFQCRDLKSIYTAEVLKDSKKAEHSTQYLLSELKKAHLTWEEIAELFSYTQRFDLDFFATPFDIKSAHFLNSLGIDIFKIGSPDFTNLLLIEEILNFKKPIILSTGMCSYEEIRKVVEILKTNKSEFYLLYCHSTYPSFPQDIDLNLIPKMERDFGVKVGYSGHERGFTQTLAAVALGASIVEKHITVNKNQPGPDHSSSLTLSEFAQMVDSIRSIEASLGSGVKKFNQGERSNRLALGKSLVYSKDLKKGTVLNLSHLKAKSPARGILPLRYKEFIGRRLLVSTKKDHLVAEHHIGNKTSKRKFIIHNLKNWGVIGRLNDYQMFLNLNPDIIEIHLTWRDLLEHNWKTSAKHRQQLVVHAPEYFKDRLIDLTCDNPEVINYSLKSLKKTINLAKRLAPSFAGTDSKKGPMIVVHPGGHSHNLPQLDKDRQYRKLREVLKKVDTNGVELLLENMPPFPWYFGGQWYNTVFLDSKEIANFAESTGWGICFDLSHAKLYCNLKDKKLSDYTKEIEPYVKYLHIADAKGVSEEGLQIGEGEIDFGKALSFLKDKNIPFVPEIWQGHLDKGQGFKKALMTLDEILEPS